MFLGENGLAGYGERKRRLHAALADLGIDNAAALFEGGGRLSGSGQEERTDEEGQKEEKGITSASPPPPPPAPPPPPSAVALRLYRSFLLPKSAGALASASTANRAAVVAGQVAFALREADAERNAWLRNVDEASAEAAAATATT